MGMSMVELLEEILIELKLVNKQLNEMSDEMQIIKKNTEKCTACA